LLLEPFNFSSECRDRVFCDVLFINSLISFHLELVDFDVGSRQKFVLLQLFVFYCLPLEGSLRQLVFKFVFLIPQVGGSELELTELAVKVIVVV
jgi:hypothetical protein